MLIQVTQEHIDKGIRGDCKACPVYYAIKEVLPEREISVEARTVLIQGTGFVESCFLPTQAVDFICEFDDPDTDPKWLEPFEFELDYEPEEKE